MKAIPWDAEAEFAELGGGKSFHSHLRECVQAYLDLPADLRSGAMIICDELIPTSDEGSMKTFEDDDLAWLASQLSGDVE